MLTDAEHEEVLEALPQWRKREGRWDCVRGLLYGLEPGDVNLNGDMVRAQMTDWLLEHKIRSISIEKLQMGFRVWMDPRRTTGSALGEGATLAEALARAVLEVSRADD